MNEKNYEYLKEQLKNTGFGDTFNADLANKISQGAPEFQLAQKKTFGKDDVIATLHFKKGADSEMYFFNRYDLQLLNDKQEIRARQMFYINKGSSITLKEGYNLLEGRAVHKTLTNKQDEKYGAWLQLDFKSTTQNGNYEMKQYHQNFGYDLEKVLAKYPIKELADEQSKQQLIRSLERGNLQAAAFEIAGKEEKLFITPNVAFKTLSAYNHAGQRVSLKDLFQNQEQSVKQEQKSEQTQKETKAMKQEGDKTLKKPKRQRNVQK
ncbi:hypothetical protein FC093_17260 [Ilyomonas limi]|uniref:DUF3945 domain-containing protein n=1 Tax=Ilyomonas limi TaxID=2575867 RepID=A0A4U3KV39_9BACT|nr:hypothetical protein [Ilyomonas limi]TKK66331.1 hypothetical protein FC093_17260 [Ilyomonas limi]